MREPRVDSTGTGHVFGSPTGEFMGLTCFKNGSLARERIRDALEAVVGRVLGHPRGRRRPATAAACCCRGSSPRSRRRCRAGRPPLRTRRARPRRSRARRDRGADDGDGPALRVDAGRGRHDSRNRRGRREPRDPPGDGGRLRRGRVSVRGRQLGVARRGASRAAEAEAAARGDAVSWESVGARTRGAGFGQPHSPEGRPRWISIAI